MNGLSWTHHVLITAILIKKLINKQTCVIYGLKAGKKRGACEFHHDIVDLSFSKHPLWKTLVEDESQVCWKVSISQLLDADVRSQ